MLTFLLFVLKYKTDNNIYYDALQLNQIVVIFNVDFAEARGGVAMTAGEVKAAAVTPQT